MTDLNSQCHVVINILFNIFSIRASILPIALCLRPAILTILATQTFAIFEHTLVIWGEFFLYSVHSHFQI